MSYFCTAMVSGARVARTRSKDARRFRVPVAAGSSGLSGNSSNRPRPRVCSSVVCVASRRARVAATMVYLGASGNSTSSTSGDCSKSSRKFGSPSAIAGKIYHGRCNLMPPSMDAPATRLPLRALFVEDSDDDAKLLQRAIHLGGYELISRRVESADQLAQALNHDWDIVISDFNLPSFRGDEALRIVRATKGPE